MNFMPKMITHTAEMRTKFRVDETGLLFLTCEAPRMFLTFKMDSETLQEDVTNGLAGLFKATGQTVNDLQLIDIQENEFVWMVTAPAFEKVLLVA